MRKRILHVTTGLELGGAERILLNCAVEGVNRGFESKVIALKSGGATRSALEQNNIPVMELGANAKIPDPFAMSRLLRAISLYKPDIVMAWMYHANLFSTLATFLSPYVSRSNFMWGIYNSNLDLAQYSWRMSAVVKAGAMLSGYPDSIVYNSKKAMQEHLTIGFHGKKNVLINNGVDTNTFKPDPAARIHTRQRLGIAADAKLAIIVARVDPQKDWTTVLKGVSMVEGLVTLAVGPTTSKLPSQNNLILHGAHMSMQELYPAADVFILPSAFGEGTSVAMCEAMACGVPVIVTDVGDNALYAKDCGRVIPAGAPDALAQAIAQLLSDKSELSRLAVNARRMAEQHFGPAASFADLFDHWERVLERKSAH